MFAGELSVVRTRESNTLGRSLQFVRIGRCISCVEHFSFAPIRKVYFCFYFAIWFFVSSNKFPGLPSARVSDKVKHIQYIEMAGRRRRTTSAVNLRWSSVICYECVPLLIAVAFWVLTLNRSDIRWSMLWFYLCMRPRPSHSRPATPSFIGKSIN